MALFQRAASMFRPLANGEGDAGRPGGGNLAGPPGAAGTDKPAGLDEEMRELRHRMESLQRQLDIMQKPRPPSE